MKKLIINNKKVECDHDTVDKVSGAIQDILDGKCSKVIISDNIKVYKCTDIIRVDFKVLEGV